MAMSHVRIKRRARDNSTCPWYIGPQPYTCRMFRCSVYCYGQVRKSCDRRLCTLSFTIAAVCRAVNNDRGSATTTWWMRGRWACHQAFVQMPTPGQVPSPDRCPRDQCSLLRTCFLGQPPSSGRLAFSRIHIGLLIFFCDKLVTHQIEICLFYCIAVWTRFIFYAIINA